MLANQPGSQRTGRHGRGVVPSDRWTSLGHPEGEPTYSQRFETRALAVRWAEEERKFLVKGGGLSGEGGG